ncbi:MAG: hypothetical protein COB24_08145 [Hyphomicrobiales bacterium]|nr:hypothetical protein [Alphaproteobacteria bacterium]PCI86918.1 MAG: hypothetical protein COB24_08145 [Hyphomicrobiales bacterium]
MDKFEAISTTATDKINHLLKDSLDKDQQKEIVNIIERAVIKAILEGQHRAVDAALKCPEADQDVAHKIATEIRKKNDALIVNLCSQR